MLHYKLQTALAILEAIHSSPGIQAKDIAQSLNCSTGLIERTIIPLVKHNYINSKRGPGGGYWISVYYPEIKLYDLANDLYCMESRIKYNDATKKTLRLWHFLQMPDGTEL